MKLGVVAGGWHYPYHFFQMLAMQADDDVDLFCIGHREPGEIPDLEKRLALNNGTPFGQPMESLWVIDRQLYASTATVDDLQSLGWELDIEANTCGDWGFLDQWLALYDWEKYDGVLFAHDDTYVRRIDMFDHFRQFLKEVPDYAIWTNGRYPEAPKFYCRGSFEIFTRRLLVALGGRIPLADTGLDRTGKTDTPKEFDALSPWNANGEPLRKFLIEHNMPVGYLGQHYRVSPYAIEGERGFLHLMGGAPWSYSKGLKEMGVI